MSTLKVTVLVVLLSAVVANAGILFGSYTQSGESPSLWQAFNAWFQSQGHPQLQQSVRVVNVGWAPIDTMKHHFDFIRDVWTYAIAVPIISFEPYPYKTWTKPAPCDDIVNGVYDDYLDAFFGNLSHNYVFERAPEFTRIAYLRFAPQPNGNWFPWSPSCPPCGSTGQRINQTAASYKRMWDYVIAKLRLPKYNLTEDTIQVMFDAATTDMTGDVSDFAPDQTNETTRAQWFSATGINWGNTLPGNNWVGANSLFKPTLKKLMAINSTTPLAITSAGTTSVPNGLEAKNAWLSDLCDLAKSMLKMISYHNADSSTDIAVFGGAKGIRNYSTPYSNDEYPEYPNWRECLQGPEFVGSNYLDSTTVINQSCFKGRC